MNSVGHILRIVAGWLLILVGIIGIFIPIFPQIPFLVAGALLLAPYFKIFQNLLSWMEKKFPSSRRFIHRFSHLRNRNSP